MRSISRKITLRRVVGIVAVAGTLSLGAPSIAFAGEVPASSGVLPTGYASISGTVRVGETPLPGAEVHFAHPGYPLNRDLRTVRAGAGGSYSVTLPPGSYLVTFTSDVGYAPAAWGDNNPVLLRSDVLDATKGGVFTGIDGNLVPSAELTGTVGGPPALVTTLEPGNNGYLVLFGYDPRSGTWQQINTRYNVDANGAYTMRWLPPGIYKIGAYADGVAVNQLMNWSDQPAGKLSREIQVGSRTGLPTAYNLQLAYPTTPGPATPIVP